MQQNLYYLSGFNNYYNRKIIKPNERLLSAFEQWTKLSVRESSFNPNDGVDTQVVANYSGISDDVEFDYLLVSTDNKNIDSKWFIIDRSRNLSGQWTLSLRRDLISDYFDSILNSTAFIEKATLNIGNKLIFNKENGINYNQIKKSEYLIKDSSEGAWIVGYYANDTPSTSVQVIQSATSFPTSPLEDIDSYIGNRFTVSDIYYNWYGSKFDANKTELNRNLWSFVYNNKGDLIQEFIIQPPTEQQRLVFDQDYDTTKRDLATELKNNLINLNQAALSFASSKFDNQLVTTDDFNTLYSMQGIVYWDSDQKKPFTISISSVGYSNDQFNLASNDGSIYTYMTDIFNNADLGEVQDFQSYTVPSGLNVNFIRESYIITKTYTTLSSKVSFTIPDTSLSLSDSPYKMFCMPYGSLVTIDTGTRSFRMSKNFSLNVACSIAMSLGSRLYDIQLLPYCPFPLIFGEVNVESYLNNVDYTIIENPDDQQAPLGIILYPRKSTFSFVNEINRLVYSLPDNNIDFKIANETQFCRICSPNYSGTFEFSPTMNYGLNGFEINCSYKPFQPYIHINPLFSSEGLYGGDFNDQRGLVCSGDFSLPIINDPWIQYQINNKSYEDSFKRQVENMDVTYGINRKQAETAGIINAISAGIGGATGGAVSGAILGGGPVSAVLGGVTGLTSGALSAYGLQKDLQFSDALHKEALSFAKDNFGYQLQNVQALPYSLGKVSAFSINNKLFPFVEFYDATEEEKEALRQKLKYNGMTVMTTGKIQSFVRHDDSFLQCQLIRYTPIESDDDPNVKQVNSLDYHTTAEIASELHKGVYI